MEGNVIAADPVAACKVCAKAFFRFRSTQAVCGPTCAAKSVRLAKKTQAADRRADREKLIALKPRSKWLSEAQAAFNAFIRARDAHLPCISCGRMHEGSWDAGHYLTRGARPELRFDEQNCHRQCVPCNQHLHGNLVLYRIELLRRIGEEGVARLEGPHEPQKYTIDQLREIRDSYRVATRELLAQGSLIEESA